MLRVNDDEVWICAFIEQHPCQRNNPFEREVFLSDLSGRI